MVKLIWLACLVVLSLEATSSWKYDRRKLKELKIGEIKISSVSQCSLTASEIIATITKTNGPDLSLAARPTFRLQRRENLLKTKCLGEIAVRFISLPQ